MHFLDYFGEFSIDTVSAVVRSTTEDGLVQWFIDNYIRKCAEHCPDIISLMCCDITDEIPDDVLNAIFHWRDHLSGKIVTQQVMSYLRFNLNHSALPPKLTVRTGRWDNYLLTLRVLLPQMMILRQSDTVTFFCHFASFILDPVRFFKAQTHLWKHRTIDILAHFLPFMCSADERHKLQVLCFDIWSEESRTVSPLQKAAVLMEFVANKRRNTRETTMYKLSKAYLQ